MINYDGTKCNNCIHSDVCKFKDEYLASLDHVADLKLYYYESIIQLENCPWAKPIKLECKFYSPVIDHWTIGPAIPCSVTSANGKDGDE